MGSKTSRQSCSKEKKSRRESLPYLIHSLFDLAETNVEVHLLLLELTTFLIEQVGVLIDKVQVVARSDSHCVSTSLCQTVVSLFSREGQYFKHESPEQLMYQLFTEIMHLL